MISEILAARQKINCESRNNREFKNPNIMDFIASKAVEIETVLCRLNVQLKIQNLNPL